MNEPDSQKAEDPSALNEISREVAEEAPIILWMTGPSGRHNYFNRRWREFTGLKEASDPEGKRWLEALHPDDRDRCLQTILAALNDYQPMRLSYRLRDHAGEYHWMLDMSRPCYASNGNFLGYVGAVVDISDQKKAEAELEGSNYNLKRANRHARLNREMNDHLQVCNDIREVHAVLSHYVPKLFSKSSGAVYMINESRSLVETVAQWGSFNAKDAVFTREDCWALRQGKTHRVIGQHGVICAHLSACPPYGYICIPLISHGDVMGLLYLQSNYAEQMDDEYRYELAQNTAENLSLALSSFRLRQALRYQSVRDPLTKLFNRRYMSESLEREIARSRRNEQQLTVAMLDMDHFKRFNDTHGHAAGDVVLQTLARYLQSNLRSEDVASRYGGEEFTLVMMDTDRNSILRRVDELRQGVHKLQVEAHDQLLEGFTVSMGLAIYPDHGEAAQELLEAADRALYRAKQQGRDQVCLADTDAGSSLAASAAG